MQDIQHTDRELLRAWLNGRESAFSELVQRHAGLVFSVAVRQTGDRSAAEEVVQDVFATLARKARALVNHPSVPAWLHVTSNNIARRERAKQASHHRKLNRLGEELTADATAGSTLTSDAHFDAAIARLPVLEREAIVLRFFEDCDYAEIAARLRISDVAARKRVSRGLERLEKSLKKDLGGGARLASLAMPVPAALITGIVSSTGKASAAAGGFLIALIGIITMNTIAKTTIAVVAGAGLAWFGASNYNARQVLEEKLASMQKITVPLPAPIPVVDSDTGAEMAGLKQQLSDVIDERDALRNELAQLNAAVGDLSEDVVVNLGRIQDLGGNYARLMVEAQQLVERFDSGEDSPSPEERQELMKEFLTGASDITAAVPEIIGFEERPKDMSRFFQSLYQRLAGLGENEAAALAPILEKHYAEAIEKELTMSHAPQLNADQFDQWKAERDSFFADVRAEIIETIPPANRDQFEDRIDDDSLWPRDFEVGQIPVVFNPAGDTAAKIYRKMEEMTQGQKSQNKGDAPE